MNARIIKSMTLSDGTILKRGDIVDVSTWRNTDALVRIRYIEVIVEDATITEAPALVKPQAKKPAAKPKAKSAATQQ